jgi:DNA-binding SARP family transcriptional activator
MGLVEAGGWVHPPERAIITHLGSFLATHTDRPVTSDRLLLALWPTESDRQEVTKKTLHNYLSTLRRDIGPEHFPDAVNAGGYRFAGVVTDWQRFRELAAEADGLYGDEANRLRTDALALVRGQPFEGAPSPTYDWVNTEALGTSISVAIVDVAHRLAGDLLANGELAHAEWAAGQGLKASPTEEILWVDRARAVRATGDSTAEQRFWRDASATLGSETVDRLRRNLDEDE